jgi:hypothetical protein
MEDEEQSKGRKGSKTDEKTGESITDKNTVEPKAVESPVEPKAVKIPVDQTVARKTVEPIEVRNNETHKTENEPQVRYSQPIQQPTYPPQQPPPQPPPYVPPPYARPPYYAPPPPPQRPPMYTWEIFPHLAKKLIRSRDEKSPALSIISVLLIVSAALAYPMAGMFIYYGSAEDLDLEGNFDMEGRIVNSTGDGISGVHVEIVGTGFNAISGPTGHYEIQNVPNGIKKVRLSVPGYKNETNILLLHPDFGTTVDFQMEKGSGELEFNNIWFFFTIAILMIMFSILVIYGSYYANKKKRFAVVLVGGTLGVLVMAPSLLFTFLPSIFIMGVIGFILSCSATIMTITNRRFFMKIQNDSEPQQSTPYQPPEEPGSSPPEPLQ